MSLEEIAVSLNRLGIRSTVLETGADGAVLVLPEYGRVLGVWPHWRGENALWVNPDFLRLLQIGAKDDSWLNPGGDRMWLGPENEFFPEGRVPPAIDPGRFQQVPEKNAFIMENKGEAHAWKSDLRMRFRIVRRIRPLTEGEIADSWGTQWLRQAGYVEETVLETAGEVPAGARLWNLTQVRAGSEVRFPLAPSSPGSGAALPEGATLSDSCASVSLRGERAVRFALTAVQAADRILCIEEREGGRGHLIVKEFQRPAESDPEAPLVECRWFPRQGAGEFSCSSPAAGPRERRRVTWKTTLCAFSGRVEELRAAALRISR